MNSIGKRLTYLLIVAVAFTCFSGINITGAEQQGSLPSVFKQVDLGDTGLAGSAGYKDGVFTINGSGEDIFGYRDTAHFVYKEITGDFEAVVRVLDITNVHFQAKAGLMVRASLESKSEVVHLGTRAKDSNYEGEPECKSEFIWRTSKKNSKGVLQIKASNIVEPEGADPEELRPPVWLKVVRKGNKFSGYKSSNGKEWVFITEQEVNMPVKAYVGLDVCAHDKTKICTAKFEGFAIKQGVKVKIPSYATRINKTPVDNTKSKYLFIVYNDATYIPLTNNYCQVLGILKKGDIKTGISISLDKNAKKTDVKTELSGKYSVKEEYTAYTLAVPIDINTKRFDNVAVANPVLIFNNIIYFPMTQKFAGNEFNCKISMDKKTGFSIEK